MRKLESHEHLSHLAAFCNFSGSRVFAAPKRYARCWTYPHTVKRIEVVYGCGFRCKGPSPARTAFADKPINRSKSGGDLMAASMPVGFYPVSKVGRHVRIFASRPP